MKQLNELTINFEQLPADLTILKELNHPLKICLTIGGEAGISMDKKQVIDKIRSFKNPNIELLDWDKKKL